jgi:4-aminobutyrate aminotransferase/(S)-3-amino-2-methylpropionate transaminase
MRESGPKIATELPGPRSRALAERLARVECPEVTCQTEPLLFFERGAGANLYDVDGNRFVDLVGGFGAAVLGYADPELARVAARQSKTLLHALGDVAPAALKVELLEALERVLPGALGCAILSSSGSDAVESALKTALRVTGRPGVVAFEGAYHGLGFGALAATHRPHFRAPFAAALSPHVRFVPFGDAGAAREAALSLRAGAILVEPIQGRGGLRIAPPGFLGELRRIADETGALLVFDEVYTGLGRTGEWLACEHDGVLPDVVALGKALGGGFPISACAGRPDVMRAWGASTGEAIHTSTHLGNPLGCAVALRVLERLERDGLVKRARELGAEALARLERGAGAATGVVEVRGRGLLLGVELDSPARAARVARGALDSGWIVLREGDDGRVLSLTPPLTIRSELLFRGLDRLAALLA